jgi:hypothetical protein
VCLVKVIEIEIAVMAQNLHPIVHLVSLSLIFDLYFSLHHINHFLMVMRTVAMTLLSLHLMKLSLTLFL